jgi:hypothetical protein
MVEVRAVTTGGLVRNPWRYGSELHQQAPRLLVSVGSCSPPCACDGWEVCLHYHDRTSKIPVWPVLSADSEEGAREVARQLRAFARQHEPDDFQGLPDPAFNGSRLLGEWLQSIGYERRTHVVWGPTKEVNPRPRAGSKQEA